MSADRSGMAALRFLPAAAACVILLRFAAESRESQCNGSVRRVNGALEANFSDFGTDDLPLKIPFQKCFKIVVFPLLRRDPVVELQIAAICGAFVRSSIVFCSSVSADRNGMAASSFPCMHAMRNTIAFCS